MQTKIWCECQDCIYWKKDKQNDTHFKGECAIDEVEIAVSEATGDATCYTYEKREGA